MDCIYITSPTSSVGNVTVNVTGTQATSPTVALKQEVFIFLVCGDTKNTALLPNVQKTKPHYPSDTRETDSHLKKL